MKQLKNLSEIEILKMIDFLDCFLQFVINDLSYEQLREIREQLLEKGLTQDLIVFDNQVKKRFEV